MAGTGRIRVVGGALRGRPILTPAGRGTRPTSSRVRAALFDILAPRVPGSSFLDAYAGSGAMGLEAASRGAGHVVFVEADVTAWRLLQRNLLLLESTRARATPFHRDLARAMPEISRLGIRFDIVFLDPPYQGGELDRAMRLVSASGALADDAVVVAEHDARAAAPSHAGLIAYRVERYGGTSLTFHRRDPALVDSRGESV